MRHSKASEARYCQCPVGAGQHWTKSGPDPPDARNSRIVTATIEEK